MQKMIVYDSVWFYSGSGRSKKTAKRAAASAMLAHIKNITQDGEEETKIEDSEEEDDIPLVSRN